MELTKEIRTTMNVVNNVANYNVCLQRAIDELRSIIHRYGFNEENNNEISKMITKLEKMNYSDYELNNYLKTLWE